MQRINHLGICLIVKPLLLFVVFGIWVLVFLQGISFYDTRYANKDRLHDDFRLVIFDKKGAFSWLTLNEFNLLKEPHYALISKNLLGEKEQGSELFSYKIAKENDGDFLVDTRWQDDDRTVWSCYKVINNQVIPVKSRLYTFDYMGVAVVLAFLSTYFLYWLFKKIIFAKMKCSIEKR